MPAQSRAARCRRATTTGDTTSRRGSPKKSQATSELGCDARIKLADYCCARKSRSVPSSTNEGGRKDQHRRAVASYPREPNLKRTDIHSFQRSGAIAWAQETQKTVWVVVAHTFWRCRPPRLKVVARAEKVWLAEQLTGAAGRGQNVRLAESGPASLGSRGWMAELVARGPALSRCHSHSGLNGIWRRESYEPSAMGSGRRRPKEMQAALYSLGSQLDRKVVDSAQ
jgi:hypothetical protein